MNPSRVVLEKKNYFREKKMQKTTLSATQNEAKLKRLNLTLLALVCSCFHRNDRKNSKILMHYIDEGIEGVESREHMYSLIFHAAQSNKRGRRNFSSFLYLSSSRKYCLLFQSGKGKHEKGISKSFRPPFYLS